jgi:hypothetical protein
LLLSNIVSALFADMTQAFFGRSTIAEVHPAMPLMVADGPPAYIRLRELRSI